jgi:diguanylate cyclase (GGDEF)-like protein
MTPQDRAQRALLELGDPAERRTRTELLERTLHTALMLLEADAVVLTSERKRGERLVLHSGSRTPAADRIPPEGSEVARRLAANGQPILISDLFDEPRLVASDGCPGVESGPALFTPVRRRDLDPGYIAVYRRRGRARFTLNDSRLMLLLATWLASALENLRLAIGTEKVAVSDELTDVYNHRYFGRALRRELRRASRFNQELSLVMIGVDQFSNHSETLGQLKSGLLLKEVASSLSQQVRSFDVLAKGAGDDFMVILPQTSRDGAAEVAERMRVAAERQAFSLGIDGAVTLSLGVASFPQDASDIRDLLAATERALHQAKERGGNLVAMPTTERAMTDLGPLLTTTTPGRRPAPSR